MITSEIADMKMTPDLRDPVTSRRYQHPVQQFKDDPKDKKDTSPKKSNPSPLAHKNLV